MNGYLNTEENKSIIKEIKNINLGNIFFIDEDKINKLISSNPLIENFQVKKKYPATIEFKLDKTKYLAKINKNGKIVNYIWGKTQTVKPEYDAGIEKILGNFFEKYHTMKLDNFKISDDEMTNVIGSEIRVNECIHKRK